MCYGGQPQSLQSKFTYDREETWNERLGNANQYVPCCCMYCRYMSRIQASHGTEETQSDFYLAHVEEMIDNTYDQPNSARNQNSSYGILNQSLFHNSTGMARSGINAHLTPTKNKRNIRGEQTTNHAKQGYCSERGRKTIRNCS